MFVLAKKTERPISYVPKPVLLGLFICLVCQIIYHVKTTELSVNIKPLQKPPSANYLLLSGLSDHILTAKAVMLWLQSYDNQPGISIPFKQLDYLRVREWLQTIQSLDEDSSYPLLAASRLYSKVLDDDKKRIMLDFVKQEYLKKPDQRWRWMAHCVYVAKYELKDLSLALEYARLLREHTSREVAPAWATQMEIFLLEDLDQLESAKILIGGLLESGEITDEHELRFLHNRLGELEDKIMDSGTSPE